LTDKKKLTVPNRYFKNQITYLVAYAQNKSKSNLASLADWTLSAETIAAIF